MLAYRYRNHSIKAAHIVAARAFLMLKTGFLEGGVLIYYPLIVVLGVVGRNNLALRYDFLTVCAYCITGITLVGAVGFLSVSYLFLVLAGWRNSLALSYCLLYTSDAADE